MCRFCCYYTAANFDLFSLNTQKPFINTDAVDLHRSRYSTQHSGYETCHPLLFCNEK